MKKIIPLAFLILFPFAGLSLPAHAQEAPAAETKSSPWEAMFPDGLVKAGQKSTAANKTHFKGMKGKFVGVYNSASWCGPCRAFTPRLVKFYKKNKKEIEIVFLSADKTEKAMLAYIKKDKMKWLAVPFGKRANTKPSRGIPHLVVYAPDGSHFTEIVGAGEKSFDALEDLSSQIKEYREENK